MKTIIPVRVEKYKPTGWLGIMLGTKLFYNLLTVDEADECARRLADKVGDDCKGPMTAMKKSLATTKMTRPSSSDRQSMNDYSSTSK